MSLKTSLRDFANHRVHLFVGYCDPVFFCASRCREPGIRRRAIAVLKKLPRQEGIWQSTGAAMIAERWVQVSSAYVLLPPVSLTAVHRSKKKD